MVKSVEEMAKEERREYQRRWRSANREKTKKHQNDYWKRKAMQKIEDNKED